MKQSVFLILLAIAAAGNARAQGVGPSTLNAAGGTANIDGDEFDWSVGEMTMVATFTGASNVILTQGLLQPAGFSNEAVHNNTLPASLLQVFPNPASSVVNIVYTSPVMGTLTYTLLDMSGQTVKTSTVAVQLGKTTAQINVSDLANASYMLEITTDADDAGAATATYKIEKLN